VTYTQVSGLREARPNLRNCASPVTAGRYSRLTNASQP
jgi:hypothetical protein